MKRKRSKGFSLVEVVIALGLFVFALVTMVALLPTGIHSNKVSIQEIQAVGILTMLEADLRNTYPSLNPKGVSEIYGLSLPYTLNNGNYAINSALTPNTATVIPSCTTGVALDGTTLPVNSVPPPAYQATVVYTSPLPGAASLAPVEARLILNWPCITSKNVSDLTNPALVTGSLDTYVSFPPP